MSREGGGELGRKPFYLVLNCKVVWPKNTLVFACFVVKYSFHVFLLRLLYLFFVCLFFLFLFFVFLFFVLYCFRHRTCILNGAPFSLPVVRSFGHNSCAKLCRAESAAQKSAMSFATNRSQNLHILASPWTRQWEITLSSLVVPSTHCVHEWTFWYLCT